MKKIFILAGGYSKEREISLQTAKSVHKELRKDKDYNRITVDMGAPEFLWDQIPLSKKVDYRQVDLGNLAPSKAFCLSMGNPHAIFFLENQETFDLEKFGGEIENHDIFPEKANISLVSILSFTEIRVKVWERGVGITSACGSAACAASVDLIK